MSATGFPSRLRPRDENLHNNGLPGWRGWVRLGGQTRSCFSERQSLSATDRSDLHKFGTWIEGDLYSFVARSRREVIYARPLSEPVHSGNERYRWLNINPAFEKHKTVEVRLHHGTTDPDRVVEWAKVCLRIVERGLRLGTLPEKPNLDVFKLLDFTPYQRAYWSDTVERQARRG